MASKVLEGDILARGRGYAPALRDGAGRPRDLTGPIFGPRCPRSPEETVPWSLEEQVFEEFGLREESFRRLRPYKPLDGAAD